LTYSVHAASTVLARMPRLWSRRKILDEIDASTLRFVRSWRPLARAPAAGSLSWPAVRLEAGRSTPHMTNASRRQRVR
jgi:hypothetical protein